MRIITRAEWGARPPRRKVAIPVPTAEHWLHHAAGAVLLGDNTVSDEDLNRIQSIQNYHMDVRGWSDIAYSFLMDADGNVFEGRGFGIAGGHTAGHNSISHALCVMGNYEVQAVDADLVPRIVEFVRFAFSEGMVPKLLTGGHRDASGASTSCPGKNLYAKIPEINDALKGDIMALTAAEEKFVKDLFKAVVTDGDSNASGWGTQSLADVRERNEAEAEGGWATKAEVQAAGLKRGDTVKLV